MAAGLNLCCWLQAGLLHTRRLRPRRGKKADCWRGAIIPRENFVVFETGGKTASSSPAEIRIGSRAEEMILAQEEPF